MDWILPSLGYVFAVGFLGVSVRIALRAFTWQELLVWTALAYGIVAACLLVTGTSFTPRGGLEGVMVAVSAAIAPMGLALLFVALSSGEASRVIPLTSAYPAVTLLLAVLVLSENLSLHAAVGTVLVVAGVILLSV